MSAFEEAVVAAVKYYQAIIAKDAAFRPCS